MSDADNLVVSDTVDARLIVDSISAGGYDCSASSGQSIDCSLAHLAAGDSQSITVTYHVAASTAAATVSNTGSATSDEQVVAASGDDTVDIESHNDVSVTKVDDKGGSSVTPSTGTVVPGTSFTYIIVVGNSGPSTATSVGVSDLEPSGVTFVWSGNGHTSVSGAVSDTIASLAPGGSVTYTVTATVSPSATGSLSNSVTVTAANDTAAGNNTATDTDTLTPQADLSILKTGPASVTQGDNFDYTIVVTNGGPSDNVGGFTVVDTLPMEVDFVAAAGCTEAPAGTVTCTDLSGLAAGTSTTITITVNAVQVGDVINSATITSTDANDNNSGNDSASANTSINSGTLFSDVAVGDSDWQNNLDGVDVLFAKSGSGGSTSYTLKATNPGTFQYRLSLTNETGIDIHMKGKKLPNVIRRGFNDLGQQRRVHDDLPDRSGPDEHHRHTDPIHGHLPRPVHRTGVRPEGQEPGQGRP